VIDESDSQHEKHPDRRISTLLGREIDSGGDAENAFDSVRVKYEFDPNVIHKSELQLETHRDPRISTLFGIKIDSSDESENVCHVIRVKCEFDLNIIDVSASCEYPESDRSIGRC
jgi:hypothetical protein